MEFTAKCGCIIEYPGMGLLSEIWDVENLNFKPRTRYICEKHKCELVIKYLEMFNTITFAQIKKTFRIPESEVVSLLHKIERDHPKNIYITVHDYTVTRIN
ncbi:hypothetical protein KAU33_09160 [Candidatus Dependentiae bacterium]|nr:hypothetical protein [Candidatus Dependentiae bacterium]